MYQILITSLSVTLTKDWGKTCFITDFEKSLASIQENVGSQLLKTQGFNSTQLSAALRKLS